MIFDAHIPLTENENYADRVVIDQDGIDLTLYGETFSASFNGQNNEDIALAVLGEDYADEDQRAEHVVMLGAMNYEGYLNMGYIYLRAAQIYREAKEARRNQEALVA